VPGLYKEARFDNFRTDIYRQMDSFTRADFAIKTARKYVENFDSMKQNGLGLYIWSSARGSGKSRLASTISNELTEKGIRNKYASASNILSEIQKTWDDKNESEATILRNYIEPEVLIVDDLGARSGQQWIDERFFSLFDTRYADLKVTIVTTNYNVDSLPFDERIRDRLADIDRFYEIPMPNETVRDKARATSGKTSLFDQLTREEG
jgi:DNA replication protein DnaC